MGQHASVSEGPRGYWIGAVGHRVRHHPRRLLSLGRRLCGHRDYYLLVLTRLHVWSQAALCLAFFMGAAAPTLAGSFMVTPVRATLTAKQPVAALTVRNESQEATVVQVEVVTWTQRDGNDVYAATRDILVTP